MKKVTLCGTLLLDEIKMIDRYPEKGMLVTITGTSRAVGGAVCNSGVDLKTLAPDIAVEARGKVGDDEKGDFILNFLSARGLDVSHVLRTKTAPTSFTDVMTLESTGERTFFTRRGACSELTPEDVDVDSLDCDLFHLGYLLLLDGMDKENAEYGTEAARLLSMVQAKGIKTSIDVVSEQSDRFERVVRPALKYCDYHMVDCEHMAWSESAAEEVDDEGQQAPPAHSTKQEAQDDQRVAKHRAKGRGRGCRGCGNHLLHHLVVCRACHIEHRVSDNLHLGSCRYKVQVIVPPIPVK